MRVFDEGKNPSYESGEFLVRIGSSRQVGARVGFEVRQVGATRQVVKEIQRLLIQIVGELKV